MKNIPLLLKHSALMMGIMLISVAALVWYSVANILKYSEHEIAESSLAETKANRELTEEVMGNIVENSLRLASSIDLNDIHTIHSVTDLYNNAAQMSSAASIQAELFALNNIHSVIHSSFIYIADADYVISTDKGITSLHNYDSMNWVNTALEKSEGMKGVWFSRWEQADETSVISFVLPFHDMKTETRGTVVINIKETSFAHYLNSEKTGFNEYILINENGYIISHVDESMLFKNIIHEPFFRQLFNDSKTDGYMHREMDGMRQLVTWSRSNDTGWINVNIYELSKQMSSIYRVQKSIVLAALLMIIIGSLLSLFVTRKLSAPIKKLVRLVNGRLHSDGHSRNELLILEKAFQKMKDEEEELQHLLYERERDTKDITIQHLIRGEVTSQAIKLFKYRHFLVTIVSIDAYRTYAIRNGRETRSYHRYKWTTEIERLCIEHAAVKCTYQGDGYFVLMINSDSTDDMQGTNQITQLLAMLQLKAFHIFQQSVTISVSKYASSLEEVNEQYLRAFEGIKQRMLQGYGKIFYWSESLNYEANHYYPDAIEKRIMSYIDQRDFESIKHELTNMRHAISSQEGMSPDRVLFISHQIVGATMTHLREKNVHIQRLFASHKNIYTQLALSETLDDVEEALVSFYEDMINYLLEHTGSEGNQHGHKIIQYIKAHYRKDIVFEQMAMEIGISYSYMRKIIISMTGMSLIDYVHTLRIQHAKDLLRTSELTITQIAEEVGYNNIRSFNRFFQKLENMTPSAYRSEQQKAVNNSIALLIKSVE